MKTTVPNSKPCSRELLVLFLCALSALLVPLSAAAQSGGVAKRYEKLREEYLRLRNTDIAVRREADWQSLADDLVRLADAERKSKEAPKALFDASILLEKLGKKHGDTELLKRSALLLARVSAAYSSDPLADDALLKEGDLLAEDLHDASAARERYQRVLSSYPQGDVAEIARARLRGESPEKPKTAPLNDSRAPSSSRKGTGPLIVLDPGHGGEDLGAVGRGGLLEKDVVLDISFELEKLLEDRLGATVRLTRRADVFMPLAERTNLANDFDAGLFISLHTNASPSRTLSGIETYYLDNSGDKSTKKLAERENSSTRFEPAQADLSFILSDLIQSAKLDDSIALANAVQRELVGHLKERWPTTKNLGVRRAPFYVLVGAHMPCILVELAFIDHDVDGRNLASKEYRKELAQGLFGGIEYFLNHR